MPCAHFHVQEHMFIFPPLCIKLSISPREQLCEYETANVVSEKESDYTRSESWGETRERERRGAGGF